MARPRRSPAYARLGIPEEDPEEALSALVNPVDIPQPDVPDLGAFGESEGQLTGGEGLEAEKLDWTPVSDEQAQRWMEEREIYDAKYKLQALVRQSREYKQDLIDKLHGGLDPSLRNTEKLGKELAQSETHSTKKQLMEAMGKDDPDEMTPQERLVMLNAADQARRGAMLTVRQQKQDDIASLSNAVSEFNLGQKTKADFIQRYTAELQEKHMAQDQTGVRSVDMQRLFNMRKALEKLDEEPPQEMIDAYNALAIRLGQSLIDIEKKEEVGATWYLPWTWGKGKSEGEQKVRRWNPQSGRLES